MSTQSQILANRQNALKSTGPRTALGKAVASQNAVKHGLTARRGVISGESQVEFDRRRAKILDELSPSTPVESILADRIVHLSWRLRRVNILQNLATDVLNEDNTSNPFKKLTQSLFKSALRDFAKSDLPPQPDHSDSSTDLTLGRLAVRDFSNSRVLDRLLMYERRLENSLYKTILEFQRLQLTREFRNQCGI